MTTLDADTTGVSRRLASVDWPMVLGGLESRGFAALPQLLGADECAGLASLYARDDVFRSRVQMEQHRFGAGEYKYFAAPLPPLVQTLRAGLYGKLAPIANRWMEALGARVRYPGDLDAFLRTCHAAGQRRPTPLLLSYREGGYNCLHQDIYGALAFPMQVVFVLSRRDRDYTGGEFLLIEQRPRAQSRGHVLTIDQGAGAAFATRERPVAGARGYYRTIMRHGVSTLTSGSRMSLGIIFHDAA